MNQNNGLKANVLAQQQGRYFAGLIIAETFPVKVYFEKKCRWINLELQSTRRCEAVVSLDKSIPKLSDTSTKAFIVGKNLFRFHGVTA